MPRFGPAELGKLASSCPASFPVTVPTQRPPQALDPGEAPGSDKSRLEPALAIGELARRAIVEHIFRECVYHRLPKPRHEPDWPASHMHPGYPDSLPASYWPELDCFRRSHMGNRMSDARRDKGPCESEAADAAHECFAHLNPGARERMVKFLDTVDQYLEEHPPTGTLESLIHEILDSINELHHDERRRIRRFLEALDERFGSPHNLNS